MTSGNGLLHALGLIACAVFAGCMAPSPVRHPTRVEIHQVTTDKAGLALFVSWDGRDEYDEVECILEKKEEVKKEEREKKEGKRWKEVDSRNSSGGGVEFFNLEQGVYRCTVKTTKLIKKRSLADGEAGELGPGGRIQSPEFKLQRPGRTYVHLPVHLAGGDTLDFGELLVVCGVPRKLTGWEKRLDIFPQVVRDALIEKFGTGRFRIVEPGVWSSLMKDWDHQASTWMGIKKNEKYHQKTVHDATAVAFVTLRRRSAGDHGLAVTLRIHSLAFKSGEVWHKRPLLYERSAGIRTESMGSDADHVISRKIFNACRKVLADLPTRRVENYLGHIKNMDLHTRPQAPSWLAPEIPRDARDANERFFEVLFGSGTRPGKTSLEQVGRPKP